MKTYLFKTTKKEFESLPPHAYLGRTFVKIGTHVIMLATPNESAMYVDNLTIHTYGRRFDIEEGEIEDYPYFKNHLSKIIKRELSK